MPIFKRLLSAIFVTCGPVVALPREHSSRLNWALHLRFLDGSISRMHTRKLDIPEICFRQRRKQKGMARVAHDILAVLKHGFSALVMCINALAGASNEPNRREICQRCSGLN